MISNISKPSDLVSDGFSLLGDEDVARDKKGGPGDASAPPGRIEFTVTRFAPAAVPFRLSRPGRISWRKSPHLPPVTAETLPVSSASPTETNSNQFSSSPSSCSLYGRGGPTETSTCLNSGQRPPALFCIAPQPLGWP